MESNHALKTLLQLQLASDALAVLHLPFILSSLNPEVLQPSAHTQKWTTRVSSLIHSKDPGARWAGLCIARQTSIHSKTLMLECAQSWVTVVLPLLSKHESEPVLKAAVRLLRTIFTTSTGVPEFQRQVSTPNVPKFSTALIAIAEKHEEQELRVLAMETLTYLVPLYPTLHRALHTSMSSVTLRFLNGSTPMPTPRRILQSASRLYAVLHHTGGKVGAANQWRKSLDETLSFAWGAFLRLRTTFKTQGYNQSAPQASTSNEDPLISVPLYVDRLRAAVFVLEDLLQSSNLRPVPLSLGPVVRLCQALLSCTREEKVEGHIDPNVHSMELSVLPDIWACGCTLVQVLARCAQRHLIPHLSRLCLQIARHLEQNHEASLRLSFLRALCAILSECTLRDTILASRLVRAILPALTILLGAQSDVQRDEDNAAANASRGKKGKKRARGYEGDEVFKITKEVILPTKMSGDVIISSLEIVRLLMSQSSVTSSTQSLTNRILLAVYMSVPSIPPSLFSWDPALHAKVYVTVQRICIELGAGTTSTLGKSLGLVIAASLHGLSSSDVMRELDLQLHPRVPPLVRALPHVESLALFRAEESQEENNMRHTLGLGSADELHRPAPPQENVTVPSASPFEAQSGITEVQPELSSVPLTRPAPFPSPSVVRETSPAYSPRHPTPMVIETPVTERAPVPTPHVPIPSTLTEPFSELNPPVAFTERRATVVAATTVSPSNATPSRPTPMAVVEDDEDDPMPSIDIGSDSDSD